MAPAADRRSLLPHGRVLALLAGFGAMVAGLSAWPGAFTSDDYWNLAEARTLGWGWDLLGRDVFGHVTPGTGAASWLVAGPGGGRYGVAVLQLVALGALVPVVAHVAARSLGAARGPALVAAVVTTSAASWASASTWWSAGLNLYPSALAGMAVLAAVARALGGERRGVAVAAASLTAGLLFSDGAVVFLVLPAALVLRAAGWTVEGVLPWLWARRVAGAVILAPLLVLIAVRASAAEPIAEVDPASPWRAIAFSAAFIMRGFLPALVGLSTGRFELAGSSTATAAFAVVVLAGALVVVRPRFRRGSGWLLAGIAATVVARGVLVAWGRLELLGWDRAIELRYLADLTWMVPVVAAGCLVRPADHQGLARVVGEEGRADPERARIDVAVASPRRRLTAVMAVTVLTGLVGQVAVARQAPARGARHYRDRMAASIRDLPPGASVLDGTVPAEVIGPEFGTFSLLSETLDPTGIPLRFGTRPPFYLADERGTLRPAELGPVSELLVDQAYTASGAPGVEHNGDCWVAGGDGALVWVPLSIEVLRFPWTIHLKGTTGADPGVAIVAAGRAPFAPVGASAVGRDRTTWVVATTGFEGGQLGFQLAPGARMCVVAGTVNQPVLVS